MNRSRTVQKTLFFSYFIPILLTVVLLSILFFAYTSRLLRSIEESSLTDITEKMTSIIDSEIARLNNLSLNITNSEILKDKIDWYLRLKNEGYPAESLENYLAVRDISNILSDIAGPIKTVPQINYIDPGRLLIGSGTYNLFHPVPEETAAAIDGIDERFGKRHFSSSIRDPLAETAFPMYRNQNYISLFRTIFNSRKEPAGIIEVKQFSETIFYGPAKAPRDFMIFTNDGIQLFPPTVMKIDTYTGLVRNNPAAGITTFEHPVTGSNEIISIGKCREIGWTILNITREANILRPVYRFLLIIIISGIVMFIISISVARRLSSLITLSLEQLNGWISNLHWDNLSPQTPADLSELTPLVEFEEIHQEFWKMNRKLHDSMKLVVQERTLQENARMLALQSQMDPHFMYNMLTTIGIMAEDGENDGIVETIGRLTSILRYTASRSRLVVPLDEETAVTDSYLQCMKIRFGDDLQYGLKLSPGLSEIEIPKLIILPLVENSIKYATGGEPPWTISLTGVMIPETGRWRIIIEDSGPGFSEQAINKINEMLGCCDEKAENQLGFHFDGLGIPNIYSRLMIFYNDDFEFELYNSAETGSACIRLGGPIEKK